MLGQSLGPPARAVFARVGKVTLPPGARTQMLPFSLSLVITEVLRYHLWARPVAKGISHEAAGRTGQTLPLAFVGVTDPIYLGQSARV